MAPSNVEETRKKLGLFSENYKTPENFFKSKEVKSRFKETIK